MTIILLNYYFTKILDRKITKHFSFRVSIILLQLNLIPKQMLAIHYFKKFSRIFQKTEIAILSVIMFHIYHENTLIWVTFREF